ncbi:hypothetical protein [Rufibacter tibetensis]|uniref:Uncharacterized protein n=1 Tax=Rufibacter tibetensis TaxID=512763 RepID=A0A0P0C0Q6_9BACT|nr:hypothetical protein [Rufibacter tibetensis]ALI98078.1 hypothetical protein DC20_02670 [Rufibacter tibetensis]
MNGYTLVENNQKFGLKRGSEEVLPCVYDAVWEHSDSLFGFREDEYYGFFSATLNKVIIEPVLSASFLLYKQHDGSNDKPRYRSEFGIHSKDWVYIELVYSLIKEKDVFPAMGDMMEVVLVHDNGYLETLTTGDGYNFLLNKLLNLSFVELSEGQIVAYWNNNLPFFSTEDEQLYLENQPLAQALAHQQFIEYVDQVISEKGIDKEEIEFREFVYEAIPDSIIEACKKHLDKYYVVSECAEDYIKSFIYLAWLYANDYVVDFGDGLHVPDDRYEFEDPDGEPGINLIILRDLLELEQIIPLLKVSGITQDYLPVLAFVN